MATFTMRRFLISVAILAVAAAIATYFAEPAEAAGFLKLPFSKMTYYVTQTYSSSHRAYDLDPGGTAVNAQIRAAAAGKAYVKRTTYWKDSGCSSRELNSGGYGLYVVIQHSNGYKTIYAHLASAKWSVGSGPINISRGQVIGVEGNTGCSYGKHLHFEVRNPSGVSVNPGNPKSCKASTSLWTTCPVSFP